MNKRDVMLIIVLLGLAGLSYLFFVRNNGEDGNRVIITVDGEHYGTYPLDGDRKIEVQSDSGYNIVVIQDGQVSIKDADCPDRYCVRQGKISARHESLICLPHKLVVELETVEDESEDGLEIDSIAK